MARPDSGESDPLGGGQGYPGMSAGGETRLAPQSIRDYFGGVNPSRNVLGQFLGSPFRQSVLDVTGAKDPGDVAAGQLVRVHRVVVHTDV
jgi:hypothetical protein